MVIRERCPRCMGTGADDYAGFAMDRCSRCGGSGVLAPEEYLDQVLRPDNDEEDGED